MTPEGTETAAVRLDDDRCELCHKPFEYCFCYPRHPGSAVPAEALAPKGTTLTPRKSSALANKFFASASNGTTNADLAYELAEIGADLINHANGHPTWLGE